MQFLGGYISAKWACTTKPLFMCVTAIQSLHYKYIHMQQPLLPFLISCNFFRFFFLLLNDPYLYACVKGHLEPSTHLESSPLFTFSTKSLGQDSPSGHLFSKTIGSRFTIAKINLGEDSPSWFIYFRSRFTLR